MQKSGEIENMILRGLHNVNIVKKIICSSHLLLPPSEGQWSKACTELVCRLLPPLSRCQVFDIGGREDECVKDRQHYQDSYLEKMKVAVKKLATGNEGGPAGIDAGFGNEDTIYLPADRMVVEVVLDCVASLRNGAGLLTKGIISVISQLQHTPMEM